jgi:shikimate kinase
MKNIVLTGFMASGKTTIGREIAGSLGCLFIDMDEDIERDTSMSVNHIFARYGEEYFRSLETEKAKTLGTRSDLVIATGGGCVLKAENIEFLRKNGIIVFLNADFEIIKSRLDTAAATRPLLQNQNISDICARFNARQNLYKNCDFQINITTDKTPRKYAEEIINFIKNKNSTSN